jgi:hypothetical protein
VLVPCGDDLHWRRIRLYFQLSDKEFALAEFHKALEQSPGRWEYLLGEEGGRCHSHVRLNPLPIPDSRSQQPEEELESPDALSYTAVSIDTHRVPLNEHRQGERVVTHDTFFAALTRSITGEKLLHPTAMVDMYYGSDEAKWRLPLLSNPPRLGGLGTDLGEVSLAGITLRFTDSKVALFDMRLDTSPTGHEYRCSAFFGWHLDLSKMERMYSELARQAHEFASLFISSGDDHDSSSDEEPD